MSGSQDEQTPPESNPNNINNNIPMHNVHVHFPINPVPKFNGDSDSFITWKACMLKYIAGVERHLTDILKDGLCPHECFNCC